MSGHQISTRERQTPERVRDETRAAQLGHRLLDILVYEECCRPGTSITLEVLAASSEIGDWKMPDLKTAMAFAFRQGWMKIDADTLTLTAAGLAAA